MALKNIIKILTVFCMTASVYAEVYTLWPKGKYSGDEIDTFLRASPLIKEDISINGVEAELKISLLTANIREILTLLKKKFPDAELAFSGDSLLVKQKLPNGWHKRLLLVCFGDFMPVLQISMTLPPKLPRASRWPEMLAITSDGIPLRYMYFSSRGTWYGSFKTHMDPSLALAEIRDSLTSQGWSAMTGESSSRQRGRGEIFLQEKPLAVMLISFSDDGTAAVLARYMK